VGRAGVPGHVGEGLDVWSAAHVADLAAALGQTGSPRSPDFATATELWGEGALGGQRSARGPVWAA
jgi:hypothetical protein